MAFGRVVPPRRVSGLAIAASTARDRREKGTSVPSRNVVNLTTDTTVASRSDVALPPWGSGKRSAPGQA